MTWLLVAIVVIVIYNAERLPQLMAKLKEDVPHFVEVSKKASKELKEKAQAMQKEKAEAKKTTSKKVKETTEDEAENNE